MSERASNLLLHVPVFKNVEYLQESFLESVQPDLEKISTRIGAIPSELYFSSYTITLNTLDSYDFSPDLIKIDVQGAEIQVLKGSISTIKKFKPVLFIEIPDDFGSDAELTSFLSDILGYSFKKLLNNYICMPFESLASEE